MGYFRKVIESNKFVDKSMFVKCFMEDPAEVLCILRPGKFGKSVNLSMLQSLLEFGASAKDFRYLKIANEMRFVSEHLGQYPVVYLNFGYCVRENWGY